MSAPLPEDSTGNSATSGGEMEIVRHYRPNRTFFTILSVLWLFPSIGASVVLAVSPKHWLRAGSVASGFKLVGVDEWIATAILLAHPLFFWLARSHYRDEPLKAVTDWDPDSDHHPGKLY